MKPDKQKTHWIIDAVLFGGFLLALWLELTGVALHEWLGLAVGALAGYHLWKHWSWVKAVTTRFLGRTSKQSRAYYVVDAALAAGFAAIAVTGLVISTWLDLPLAGYATWLDVHVIASVATLALLVGKIGLHWRWIANVARRNVFPARPMVGGQPAPAAAQIGRRDFVRMMAGVGAAALLSGYNALKQPEDEAAAAASPAPAASGAQAQATATPQAAQTKSTTATQAQAATAASASTSTTCVVRCNKRCSYPGRCRRYVDSNKNGKCDLGECVA
jgi:hypothetical protein